MTATHAASPPTPTSARVSQTGVLNSEWIKFRSLRSTWFSLLAAVLIIDGLGTLFSFLHTQNMEQGIGPGGAIFDFDATQVSLRGVFLAQLATGVLGVLVITGEYGTGMIRATLTAVPRRLPVLIAKTIVFAIPVFAISLCATFIGFLLGQQAQASTHSEASLTTPGAVRAILGAAVFLALIGVLGIGLGFLIRHTAGAIAALFGIVLVAPLLAQALPNPYSTDVAKYLPLMAGQRIIQTVNPDPDLLAPWAGIGVVALYALAALIAGAIMLHRHDA